MWVPEGYSSVEKQYSSFEHLVLSVCPDRGKGWRFVMADAVTVYVDDSGTDTRSKVAAAAFCVSTVERWQAFLDEWNHIAAFFDFELKQFHMTEFAACRRDHLCKQCEFGHTSAADHPWQKWSEVKRKNVLIRMAHAIVKHVEWGVGQSYTKNDFDEHVRRSPVRPALADPIAEEYVTFAVQRCGGSFAEWRAANSRRDRLKFVFDTSSKKEKHDIAKVFFAAANDTTQLVNGVEQWFNPEEGVSYESRKVTHQLLAADIVAWTIATVRAKHLFHYVRFVEAFWLSKVFVSTKHIRIGYLSKKALIQWEKDKLNEAEAVRNKLGVSEVRSDDAEANPGSTQRDQGETGSGESGKEKEESKK
jgi:Protein of unknown function (DUF3800)